MHKCGFYYNGVGADGGGSYTMQAGIEPGVIVMRLLTRYACEQFGTVVITDGVRSYTVRNCRLSKIVLTQGTSGRWQELTILDRRWLWSDERVKISGEYNRNSTLFKNVKSARALAALCLDQMGESLYDVSALPVTAYPPVAWDAANPASELDTICQVFGCVVARDANDRVVIVKQGQGFGPIASAKQADIGSATDYPVIPREVIFEGGPTEFLYDLPLQAIGKDTDGSYKPIDLLSYAPANWADQNPQAWNLADAAERKLANEHVYRRYGIATGFNVPIPPAYLQPIISGYDLKIQRNQARFFNIASGEQWRIQVVTDKEIEPIGYYFKGGETNKNTVNAAGSECTTEAACVADTPAIQTVNNALPQVVAERLKITVPFEYDADLNHIVFERPIWFQDAAQGNIPPIMRLRLRFNLRGHLTAAPLCQQYRYPVASNSAANVYTHTKDADFALQVTPWGHNGDEFKTYAVLAAAEVLNGLATRQGASIPYTGFYFDRVPDGIVSAVTWDVSEQGEGSTHVDYNVDSPEFYGSLNEIRNARALAANAAAVKQFMKRFRK